MFDFGLYFFHNAKRAASRAAPARTSTCRRWSHLEARLWNDVFTAGPERTRRAARHDPATVLIETIMAAFEMDEILYELREHSAGLNCGPLGLHLLVHQEVPKQPDFMPRRSRAGDDDEPVHARLLATCW
jgi:malate synthase